MVEDVLLQGSGVLERFPTGLTDELLEVGVGDGVFAEVVLGEEAGAAHIAGELLLLLPETRVFEIPVESEVVFLGARESTVLTHKGFLSIVSSAVDHKPSLLAEHFPTHFTWESLVVFQGFVFVSQLIRDKPFAAKVALEHFLLLILFQYVCLSVFSLISFHLSS